MPEHYLAVPRQMQGNTLIKLLVVKYKGCDYI